MKTLLCSLVLLGTALGLGAAPQPPAYPEGKTLHDAFFAYREAYRIWWAQVPENERREMRRTWWKDGAKNNFHDVIEARYPEQALVLAQDLDPRRFRNFGAFFEWFRADPARAEALERRVLMQRAKVMEASLPGGDPLKGTLTEWVQALPEGPLHAPYRMQAYWALVEISILESRRETVDYMRDILKGIGPEADPTLTAAVVDLSETLKAERDRLSRLLDGDGVYAPVPDAVVQALQDLSRQVAAARIRHAGVDELLFAQRTPAEGTHWYESFGYWCHTYSDDPEDWNLQYQGRLVTLDLETLTETDLLSDPEGGIREPCVSFDGSTILFAYRPGGTLHNHLYEINVDGTGLRQLTDGPDDDIEPIYLPDGDLVFTSSRARRWVPCLDAQVATLHRSGPDGENIRMLTANVETENTPWVMPDGRLLFMRWEYVERDRGFPHGLWTINPDGTGIMTFWGNMNEPDVFIDAKPIPGTRDVIFVRHPHGSGEHIGSLAVLNPDDGPDEKQSVRQITPKIRPNPKTGYRDPWPIAPGVYLACQQDRMYLLDDQGRRLLLHTVPQGWIHEPRALQAVEPPPVIPSSIDMASDTAHLILADVTQGRRLGDLPYNEVKELLLFEILPKPVHHIGHTENLSYNGNFFLERMIGRVPVEPDGSAFFEVPPLRNIAMVALDEDGNSIKRMQSFVTLQPGEVSSCVGCHENRTETSPRVTNLQALRRAASVAEYPEEMPEIFHYPRDIQPILDRHCVSCHDNDTRAGDLVLNGDLSPWFNQSYVSLRTRGHMAAGWGGIDGQGNLPPRSTGAGASDVYTMARDGHGGVSLSQEEMDTIYYWLESWAQYSGTFAFLNNDNNQRVPPQARDLLQRRCVDCHGTDGLWGSVKAPFTRLNWAPPNPADMRETFGLRVNISHPDQSLLLRAPLSTEAGGLGLCRDRKAVTDQAAWFEKLKNFPLDTSDPEAGVFANTEDPDYQELLKMLEGFAENNRKGRMEGPDPVPNAEWIREMKRNGILAEDEEAYDRELQWYFDVDEAYYRSFWHKPDPRVGGTE